MEIDGTSLRDRSTWVLRFSSERSSEMNSRMTLLSTVSSLKLGFSWQRHQAVDAIHRAWRVTSTYL